MAEPSQSKIIEIPQKFGPDDREDIGEDIVAFIRERTQKGLDINNNLFAGYSKFYEKSGETVDLRFSGDMMADLEVLSHGPGFIVIGFVDETSNDKARWSQDPYGKAKGKRPPREFVGISPKDLSRILKRYDF